MMQKLTSRKFWMAIAAFLSSIGATLAGFGSGNDTVAIAGVVCAALSAAIYAATEAYVDAAREASQVVNITASTTAKDVVAKVLTPTQVEETKSEQ